MVDPSMVYVDRFMCLAYLFPVRGDSFERHVDRFMSRLDRFMSRLDRFMSRVDRFTSRVDRLMARVDRFMSRVDRFMARVDRFMARVDRFMARVDRFMARIDCSRRYIDRSPPTIDLNRARIDLCGALNDLRMACLDHFRGRIGSLAGPKASLYFYNVFSGAFIPRSHRRSVRRIRPALHLKNPEGHFFAYTRPEPPEIAARKARSMAHRRLLATPGLLVIEHATSRLLGGTA